MYRKQLCNWSPPQDTERASMETRLLPWEQRKIPSVNSLGTARSRDGSTRIRKDTSDVIAV